MMATQRYISTSFWDDSWVHKLDPSEKLLFLYLMTNPLTNIAGIYKLSIERMVFDTGFNEHTVKHILEKFNKAGKVITHGEFIILPSWPKHQKTTSPRIRAGIEAILNETPKEVIFLAKQSNYTYPIDTLLIGYSYGSNYSDLNSDSDRDINNTSEITAADFIPDPEFNADSPEAVLASLLLTEHRKIDAVFLSGKDAATIKRWSADIEKLMRIDKRSFDEIQRVILWCQTPGCFWAPNILSGSKLREKFPQLVLQADGKSSSEPKGLSSQASRVIHGPTENELLEMKRQNADFGNIGGADFVREAVAQRRGFENTGEKV